MKKVRESAPKSLFEDEGPEDELLPHYDFKGGVRGKYAAQMQPGMEIMVNGERFMIQSDRSLKAVDRK
jgi:hypothetical protein